MWPFTHCGQDGCTARDPNTTDSRALLALLCLAAAFVVVHILVVRHIFPKLSRAHDELRDGENHHLPAHAPSALRQAHAEHGAKSSRRKFAAWTFGATVALAFTLGLIILAEILEVVDPAARNLALRLTVPALLFLLIVLVPWLQCRVLITSAGWSFQRTAKGSIPKMAWALRFLLFGAWLLTFWSVGNTVPESATKELYERGISRPYSEALTKDCLERVGVVGICLMALLAGFASVSTPWHTFVDAATRRRRPVTEADVHRKRTGLEATREMLASKRHQLRQLERRAQNPAAAAASQGPTRLVAKVVGTFRGISSDEAEMRALRVDISGLETMEANLASNLAMMQNHRAATVRASTVCGRIMLVPSHVFAGYCVYRILATALTTFRRIHSPSATFSNSDPINRFLGLMARHWDPKLDQLAWARTISFALSGVILLASANSVVQTFHLFAKWTPGLLRQAQANLALVVGQVTATYVISASLLLRSQLPATAGAALTGILQGALSPSFVDHWFEMWFLLGSVLTLLGVWMGRRLSRGFGDDEWDDYGAEEMGAKRS
ncbi:GPCR 89-related protein [Metarhizium album ARSEF 1941]|uniref:GPCR 89-related protein n=1 Tax=Metarhizium album (strain ARSEF 1941) TaxID=1081103 RepID=A0A0B2WVW4_METAS|nr:GPCR 89-related protein [Metarhizium album ARSEF 1941]KHN97602.1 GPCR 89-related protein [Metarhizium album ARSEF 1941]